MINVSPRSLKDTYENVMRVFFSMYFLIFGGCMCFNNLSYALLHLHETILQSILSVHIIPYLIGLVLILLGCECFETYIKASENEQIYKVYTKAWYSSLFIKLGRLLLNHRSLLVVIFWGLIYAVILTAVAISSLHIIALV